MCGFVGRARLNINLPGFRKADTETRRRIVREIMDHFNIPEERSMQVEHAALKKARDVTKADCAEFKRVRATPEFVEKSFKQSELQKKNIHPHHMGVEGHYGMKLIWNRRTKKQ